MRFPLPLPCFFFLLLGPRTAGTAGRASSRLPALQSGTPTHTQNEDRSVVSAARWGLDRSRSTAARLA